MRRICFASLAALTLGSVQAVFAADMPIKAPLPPPTYWSWTGCYVGGQAGGGFMHDSNDDAADTIFHGGGAIAGGQVGCNLQVVQQLVIGIEGEGWWSSLKDPQGSSNTETTSYTGPPAYSFTEMSSSNSQITNLWDATAAVRLGWAFDRVLLYGKGGVAFGGFNFSESRSLNEYCTPANTSCNYTAQAYGSGSATLTGMVFGVGIEWAFAGNWIGRVEGDYLNFARSSVPMTYSATCTPCTSSVAGSATTSGYAAKELLKVGLSYKFY